MRHFRRLSVVCLSLLLLVQVLVPLFSFEHASAAHPQSFIQLSTPDTINGVAADSNAIYIAGLVPKVSAPDDKDAFVRKYDTNFNEVWTKQFGTPFFDSINGIALHSTGLYVVGTTRGDFFDDTSSGEPYAFVRKYDNTGNAIWTKVFRPDSGSASANSIAVDASGVYITGGVQNGLLPNQTVPPASGGEDGFIRKYDASGNHIWTRQFALKPDSSERLVSNGIATDSNSLYITGTAGDLGTTYVAKYAKNGTKIWSQSFEYSGRGSTGNDVAVSAGVVYAVGGGSLAGAHITALDTNGIVKWSTRVFLAGNDQGLGVAADSSGAYMGIRGRSWEDDGPEDGVVRKFAPGGKILWTNTVWSGEFSEERGHPDLVKDVAVVSGVLYAVGSAELDLFADPSGNPSGGNFIIKYTTDSAKKKIDFNGDGFADAAMGVPGEDLNTSTKVDSGAVNVIYGSAGGLSATSARADQLWTQDSAGIEGASEVGDKFGSALTAGDFNGDGFSDLAVGAPSEDIGSIVDTGSVNVIYGSSSGLSSSAVLPDQIFSQDTAEVDDICENGDLFSSSLAMGDFNHDGYDDLAIGAHGEDIDSIQDAGLVQIIYGSTGGFVVNPGAAVIEDQIWHQDIDEIEDASEPLDFFGRSLAAGDFNTDGITDLAIGAYGEDNEPVLNDGAVHIIFGSLASGLSATFIPDLMFDDQNSNEDGVAFGYSVAAGNFGNRAGAYLVVGSPFADVGAISDAGQVYLYTTDGLAQIWNQDSPSVEGAAETGDNFGITLAVGSFNPDIYDDLAVGAPKEDIGSVTDAGSVNVVYGYQSGLSATVVSASLTTGKADQIWSQDSTSIEDVNEPNDMYGSSLSVGDFNNDKRDDLVVGIPFEDLSGITNAGAVNLIYGASSGLSATSKPDQLWSQNSASVEDANESQDNFGHAIS